MPTILRPGVIGVDGLTFQHRGEFLFVSFLTAITDAYFFSHRHHTPAHASELCGSCSMRVASLRNGLIRRTATVLRFNVVTDFEASQAGNRACPEARVIPGIQVDLGIAEDFARKIERNGYEVGGRWGEYGF